MDGIFVWKDRFCEDAYVIGKAVAKSKTVLKTIMMLDGNAMDRIGLGKVKDRIDILNTGQPLEIELHWDIAEK